MAAIAETVSSGRDALLARLDSLENPYGLVNLWEMLIFDGGKLARAMQFLADNADLSRLNNRFRDISPQQQDFYRRNVSMISGYCVEAGFPMTKVILDRIEGAIDNDWFTLGMMGEWLTEAKGRLRDEAAGHKLLELQPQKVRYYQDAVCFFGAEVAAAFPSASYDIEEAAKCFALNRSTACVFHLMRILETGLRVFARRFSVPADHTNWQTVIERIEKAVRNMGADPVKPGDWKDQQEFFSQVASHFMVIKDAWRNYTVHARGKYTDEEAELLFGNMRSFMQKLAARLRE